MSRAAGQVSQYELAGRILACNLRLELPAQLHQIGQVFPRECPAVDGIGLHAAASDDISDRCLYLC